MNQECQLDICNECEEYAHCGYRLKLINEGGNEDGK